MNNTQKVYVFVASGSEEIEALAVVDLLRRANLEVSLISTEDKREVLGSHGITMVADLTIGEADLQDARMLVLPGGMPGTKNLEACEALIHAIGQMPGEDQWLAAICAAPSILGHLGLLRGRSACCYPGFEKDLEGAFVSQEAVVVSRQSSSQECHVLTSRGMGTVIDFALAIISELVSPEASKELKEKILYSF